MFWLWKKTGEFSFKNECLLQKYMWHFQNFKIKMKDLSVWHIQLLVFPTYRNKIEIIICKTRNKFFWSFISLWKQSFSFCSYTTMAESIWGKLLLQRQTPLRTSYTTPTVWVVCHLNLLTTKCTDMKSGLSPCSQIDYQWHVFWIQIKYIVRKTLLHTGILDTLI